MINLLPYGTKQQLKAARFNLMLLRYLVVLAISAVFLTIACLTTYFFINNTFLLASPPTTNSSSNKLQSDANTIKANLTTAKTILDQQVPYGKVILAINNALPSGTKIDNLALNDGSFGTTTKLAVLATTADHSNALKTNFTSSPYFSNYKLESTTAGQDPSSKYPFTLNISFTVKKVVAS
jgi:Tfp pilus assembly protein PilN